MSPLAKSVLSAFASTFLLACPAEVGNVYSPDEWQGLFKENGWTALPFPDSKYEPGAIVKVTAESGIRYIDHLRSCGYPGRWLLGFPLRDGHASEGQRIAGAGPQLSAARAA